MDMGECDANPRAGSVVYLVSVLLESGLLNISVLLCATLLS